jgi:acyl-homoserine-lactone acylase
MVMPQFMPRRDNRFDYTRPVDGSDPATDWGALHALNELPSTIAPSNGWVMNTNSWPYRAAGPSTLNPAAFPKYLDMDGPNWREAHAIQLLSGSKGWTLDRLQAAAFDSYQPAFAEYVPALLKAFDALPKKDTRRVRLAGPIALLRTWNYRWSSGSVAQSLAIYWGDALVKLLNPPADEPKNRYMDRLARDTTAAQKLQALDTAVARLRKDFGWGQVPWGDINSFQRISPSITPTFNDALPSIPVPFADAKYGSLASLEMRVPQTTKRRYGTYGNSFVAVVEFGKRVRARAVTAGGESSNPSSKHFSDQAERYASGNLRDVYFYPDQLSGHTERRYRPGE